MEKAIRSKSEVHVWQGSLNVSTAQLTKFKSILSSDELARSDRFKFEIHRHRYIVSRGYLRLLLADLLGVAAKEICFGYGSRGKPEVTGIWFNLSHAEDRVVYCFSPHYLVGIDLEYLLKEVDCDRLSSRFFTPSEARLIQSMEGKEKQKAFFQLWTAKEAYLKATGEGLVGGLDKVEIGIDKGESQIKAIANNKIAAQSWQLNCFEIEKDFIATVAVRGDGDLTIRQHKLN